MSHLTQDLQFALRILRRNLSVTLLATVSLALAIAGNTAVYSLVNSFLHRPLPYEQVESLVFLSSRSADQPGGQLNAVSPANYLDLAANQRSLEGTAAFVGGGAILDPDGVRRQVDLGRVTPGFFPLLGSPPALGRSFLEEEGVEGRHRVAILSHAFWSERFTGRRDLEQLDVELNGHQYDVVGVAGEDFDWLAAAGIDVWVPLVLEPEQEPRDTRTLLAFGRLTDGVSQRAAEEELNGLMAELAESYPEANRGFSLQLLNMRDDIPSPQVRMFLQLMQVALVFVLLIACANVANLLLARSQAREREIAIRNSVGADRRRIMGQLFTESLVMAAMAGAAGIFLGYLAMRIIRYALSSFLPTVWAPVLDLRVLGYSIAITLVAGLLFGLAPVIQTSRFDLLAGLKDSGRGATAGGKRRLAANALVVAEIAFALAFLAGAGMMIRTFQTMQNADPGFSTQPLLTFSASLPEERYEDPARQLTAVLEMDQRLTALPGVTAAAVSDLPVRGSFMPSRGFRVEGRPAPPEGTQPKVPVLSVGPAFFDVLGIPLERGRTFRRGDEPGAPPVAVINRTMAERHWPDESPLGQRLVVGDEARQVVGVVADVQHDLMVYGKTATPQVYLPWAQEPSPRFRFTLAADVEPGSLIEPVRRQLRDFDPNLSVSGLQTVDDMVAGVWVGQRVFTAILTAFGALALLLAAFGTYGVLAYSVARRTHEIGIRMAIGAHRGSLVRMVARQGLVLGLVGVLFGIPLILAEVKIIASIFAGSVPAAGSSVALVAVLLLLIILAASVVPARRAASVDPMVALRAE